MTGTRTRSFPAASAVLCAAVWLFAALPYLARSPDERPRSPGTEQLELTPDFVDRALPEIMDGMARILDAPSAARCRSWGRGTIVVKRSITRAQTL